MPSGAQGPEVNQQDLKITAKEVNSLAPLCLRQKVWLAVKKKLPFYVFWF